MSNSWNLTILLGIIMGTRLLFYELSTGTSDEIVRKYIKEQIDVDPKYAKLVR
ncbi:MAG: hypothetical protein ABFD50_14545 [Smithella sp.]